MVLLSTRTMAEEGAKQKNNANEAAKQKNDAKRGYKAQDQC